MKLSFLNKNSCGKGQRDRFYDKTDIAKHREWRGLSDTWYDYRQWVVNMGIFGTFMAKMPVRLAKGMLEYRWFGSYLASLAMVDRAVEGLRGPALEAAHMQMHTVMRGATAQIGAMLEGDRRFGENEAAGRQVLFEQTMPGDILAGFPALTPLTFEAFQGLLGCFQDQRLAPYYLDIMEKAGLPADSCRLSATTAGIALNDDFPKNGACLIMNNMPCDSSTMNSQLVDRILDIPSLAVCMPMRWEDESTDAYAVERLEKLAAFVESVTGEHFDKNALIEGMKKHNAEVENEFAAWEFASTPYTIYAAQAFNLFHVFYYTFSGGSNPEVVKTQKKVLALAEKTYREKINAFPKTRHRALTWGAPACFYAQFANWLYNCWGILQIMAMDSFDGNVIIDTSTYESTMLGIAKNYEKSIMRRHLTGGYEHMLEFWDESEKFNCDIIIMYDDITCKGALGMSGIINDQAKMHPDRHLITLQHDLFDCRTINRNEFRRQVNDYMTAVLREEPLDATLLDYDDSEGW